MKKVLLVLSSAILLIACENISNKRIGPAAKSTSLIKDNLKGKVQSYTEVSYSVENTGKMEKSNSAHTTVWIFDDEGYLTKIITKDQGGKVISETSISYYDNGNQKNIIAVQSGKQAFKVSFELDKDGGYSGGKTYDSTGKQDSYYKDLQVNEYGLLYAAKQYLMNDKILQTWDSKYNRANLIEYTATDSTGNTSYTGTYKYNERGDLMEEYSTRREKDSTKIEKKSYKYDTYDDKGNWTQQTTLNEKSNPSKVVKRTFVYYKD